MFLSCSFNADTKIASAEKYINTIDSVVETLDPNLTESEIRFFRNQSRSFEIMREAMYPFIKRIDVETGVEIYDESFAGVWIDNDGNLTINGNNVSVNGLKLSQNNFPTGRLTIPDQFYGKTVTEVVFNAFFNRACITTVTIPSTVTCVGHNAFYNTGIWNNTDNISNNIVYADKWIIGSKGTVASNVVFRNNTKGIADYALYYNGNIVDVSIPVSVNYVGNGAFSNCPSIKRIWIPLSVTSIEAQAFAACSSLTIYVQAASKPEGWNTNWNSDNRPVIWKSPEPYCETINDPVIPGVTIPKTGATPVQTINAAQYTGTVFWKDSAGVQLPVGQVFTSGKQ